MKFTVDTAKYFYSDEEEVNELEKIGFNFKIKNGEPGTIFEDSFTIGKDIEIELNSLEELVEFSEKFGDLIIDGVDKKITIYNGYV